MKELRSNIIQFPTKRKQVDVCRIVSLPTAARCQPSTSVTTTIPRQAHRAIPPLQPQVTLEAITPSDRVQWQHLATQAERINQLAAELETAMFELKAIASQLDRTYAPSQSACEYRTAAVPCVKRHKTSGFILTTRVVDLFQAEREAQQLAQTLRQRTKKSTRRSHLLSWLL